MNRLLKLKGVPQTPFVPQMQNSDPPKIGVLTSATNSLRNYASVCPRLERSGGVGGFAVSISISFSSIRQNNRFGPLQDGESGVPCVCSGWVVSSGAGGRDIGTLGRARWTIGKQERDMLATPAGLRRGRGDVEVMGRSCLRGMVGPRVGWRWAWCWFIGGMGRCR